MGKYNGAVITAAGQNLIAQAIAESKTVTFTTAQASSHVYPSSTDFEALTALTDVEKTVDINYAGVYSDTVIQVSARFDNDGVETAYLINTLGFFAQLGSDTPILFAVSTAVTPDQMPVFDADNPSAFIYNMQITVQNADSINVSVNPAGTVTVDQLNTVVSVIDANIGDLSDLTTDDKASLVNSINEVDAHADTAQASADIVQAQVSDSDDAYDPARPYKVGDLCIYNNALYRCVTACSAGSWTTNQSCFEKDTLTNAAIFLSSQINQALARIGSLLIRTINWEYNIPGNGSAQTNLKALIDNDMPNGYSFCGIVGYRTNNSYIFIASAIYISNSYSLQIRNTSSSSSSNVVNISYLCIKTS